MNQVKLKVVKQEMARVNVDILRISNLKWTGMGEFNSDNHCIYYCRQEFLRRNGIALIVNKRVQNAVLGCNLLFDYFQFALIPGPNIPGSYAILLFIASDFISITIHIHN